MKQITQLARRPAVRIGLNVAALVLVLLFLSYGIYTNWDELRQYEWTADFRYVLLAAAFYGLCFAVVLLAWHAVMVGLEAMANLRVNARIFCYSSLPRRIPGAVWYIASRAHLYKKEGVARSVTMLGTLLETVLLIVSGLLVYLILLLFPVSAKSMGHLSPGTVLLLLVPLLIVLHPAVFNRLFGYLLRKLHYTGGLSLTFTRNAVLVLIYSLAWVMGGVDLYLLANAIHPVPLEFLPAVIGAWAASGAISLVSSYLIQGLGIAEATLALLLSTFLPLPVSIVISIFFRILLTVSEVVWALLLAWALSGFKGLRPGRQASEPPASSQKK